LGRTAWNAFVESSDDAWLWHHYDLRDTVTTWPGSEDCSIAVLDRATSGQVAAILPLRRVNRRFLGFAPVYVLESLGGPAMLNGISTKRRREILSVIRDQLLLIAEHGRCLEIRLFSPPMAPALRGERCPRVAPLLAAGCENTQSQTWVVDLRGGKDIVWAHMEGRARTAVRKAEKAGVRIRVATTEDLDVYYALHMETYRRTGVQPHPRAYFQAIWDLFLQEGLARVWIAELDGQAVAAENFGVYKNAAVYWTGAASEKGLEVEANSLLQWTAMQWMAGNGIDWYETGEAFPQVMSGKLRGLSDFKKSFGGEMFPYFKGRLPLGRLGEKLYRCAREFRS
jgi:hypothetical protein